jgi:hypothetical protein
VFVSRTIFQFVLNNKKRGEALSIYTRNRDHSPTSSSLFNLL